jgi:YHS domain-containing protein
MFRFILYMILAIFAITLLRTVIGVVAKALGALVQGGAEPDKKARTLGGVLRKDPVCGTYVPEGGSPSVQRDGVTYYFCSEKCKDAFRAG